MRRTNGREPRKVTTPPVIVGIGASAGGLESFSQLLTAMPADTGMAFVLVQHLDRLHPSLLSEALSRTTSMPVREIRNGISVRPNHVYVIPPNGTIGIKAGVLSLALRSRETRKPHMSIDFFFEALAADQGGRSIGMVLSGTGNDGTEGLRAIKAADGVTLVQDPSTAKFGGMPESAVAAGVVDVCLPIAGLAEELTRLAQDAHIVSARLEPLAGEGDQAVFDAILVLIRNAARVDYREYKEATIKRRLARRMGMRKVEGLSAYLQLLESEPAELRALTEEVLIHVTSFFRGPAAFEALKKRVFPGLLENRRLGAPIRMWVPGCSTGEEAYSLAIAFIEYLEDHGEKCPLQVFGSDVSERAILRARSGLYAESDVSRLSPERLRRFFVPVDEGYRISKRVRECCIFVRHDVSRDPPFSKLDVVSCRNLLIYFGLALQRRVLGLMHYALNPLGCLMLGGMETASSAPTLFSVLDNESKLYTRSSVAPTIQLARSSDARLVTAPPGTRRAIHPVQTPAIIDVSRRIDALILAEYAPCGAVINEKMEILQFRGHTGRYLEAAPGHPQLNILKMAREGLLSGLRGALSQARKTGVSVRREGVELHEKNGTVTKCNVIVVPVPGSAFPTERLFLVLFEDRPAIVLGSESAGGPSSAQQDTDAREDERKKDGRFAEELTATRDYLQALTEEHQQTNEALLSTNEELMSANEELQSMNEELETAKEELQSTNEELTTVNDELQNRNQELGQTNNDLINVLSSVEIPIVILDADRRIRRFTPGVKDFLNVLPVDVGRPIDEIRANVAIEALDTQIAEVIDTITLKEFEVQDRGLRWHRMQIRPYKTLENKIEGVVMSFVDIDPLKRAVAEAEWARDYASSLVEAVQVPLVVLDENIIVLSANPAFYELFGELSADTEGHSLYALGFGQWDTPETRSALAHVLAQGVRFQNMELTLDFPRLGMRTVSLSARAVGSGAPRILLAIEDITRRARAEVERIALLHQTSSAKEEAERANKAKDLFLASLSHDLRTPLSSLLLQAQLLGRGATDAEKTIRIAQRMERGVKMQAKLIDDLLDVSRIASGKLKIDLRAVDLGAIIQSSIEVAGPTAERKGIELRSFLEKSAGQVMGDALRLQQLFINLLTNAIKFTDKGGRVTITSSPDSAGRHLRVAITDTGIGIKAESLSRVFDRFTQLDTPVSVTNGGLGLGLAIVRQLAEAHGGTVKAESPGEGKGSTFTVRLPLAQHSQRSASAAKVAAADSGASVPLPVGSCPSRRASLGGLRILVVDDDPGTREVLVDILEGTQADIRTAASAEEALLAIAEYRPDLLVSDIVMPGQDGYTFLGRVRALGPSRGGDVPALALTALATAEDHDRALAAGFQMHLAKPVDFRRLEAALLDL